MPVRNSDVAAALNKMADLLDIKGVNPFRVQAYRNAASSLSSLSRDVKDMLDENDDLTKISGVGKRMADKIEEIVKTGSLKQLEKLERKLPETLGDLMNLRRLGPKRVKVLHDELEIETLDDLKRAAEEKRLRELDGFGPKTEKQILDEIERVRKDDTRERFRLDVADDLAGPLVDYLDNIKGVKNVEVAGSIRRRKETIGDLDILITAKRGSDVMDKFVKFDDIDEVIAKGSTKTSVRLRQGIQVDLRKVPQVAWGAALQYFTGSKAHSVALRKRAVKRKLKISEYGVFKSGDRVAGRTEKEVYEKLGLKYIPPELRENDGEIEAAAKNRLPAIIELDDIRGDLQAHTTASDGRSSLESMAEAAREMGYEYLAITDHSKRVAMAGGLDEKALGKLIDKIDKLNSKQKSGFLILKSCEVDILKDGSLDLDNSILKQLDLVVCSIHYDTNLSEDKQTKRVLKAMDNPHFNIFAHPTGRRIGDRDPYPIDLEKVVRHAAEVGCYLEINAQPERLDLKDSHCKMAREHGLKFSLGTDAHAAAELHYMRFGVDQARRAWLKADDILNTRKYKELKKLLKRK